MNRLLIIEDEAVIRKAMTRLLERNNYEVIAVATVELAIEQPLHAFDLIIADLRLPGAEGTEIIAHAAPVPVMIMTSHASVRSAVQSMQLGAIDYISKPFDHDELILVVERSLRNNRLQSQYRAMRLDLERLFPADDMISLSTTMKSLLGRIAPLDSHLFIHGERGSGKELLARLIHHSGVRADGPLVFADLPLYEPDSLDPLLLGAEWSPEAQEDSPRMGLLHTAHGGTLILRNVELLGHETQRRLAHLVQQTEQPGPENRMQVRRGVNVRLIAISLNSPETNNRENLLEPSFAALFSDRDFHVPPLRERREDLAQLSSHYLGIYVRRYRKRRIRLSTQAEHAILAYDWPGNVNELKSALERSALLCDADEVNASHLGLDIQASTNSVDATRLNQHGLSLDGYFRFFVLQHQHALSETELAQRLGISRKSLWERRQKMNLPKQE